MRSRLPLFGLVLAGALTWSAALAGAIAWGSAVAVAQQDPNDPLGLGTKRGIQMMNQSGQVGEVTLFKRGAKTFVDVRMQGVPGGKTEMVAIHRNRDCDQPVDMAPAFKLDDLVHGRSRTLIPAPVTRLLSGNYSVIVGSKEKTEHLFACGHLY
jgi:hypothetical protein